MSTSLSDYVKTVLARPDVQQALRQEEQKAKRARARRRDREAAEAPFVQRPSTFWAVKGEWRAEDVEPFLAPPRSSLNPAFILGDDEL